MDETEALRQEIIAGGTPRDDTWNTEELQHDFVVHWFLAPVVGVTRKSDGVDGTLLFEHHPRLYFKFAPELRSVRW